MHRLMSLYQTLGPSMWSYLWKYIYSGEIILGTRCVVYWRGKCPLNGRRDMLCIYLVLISALFTYSFGHVTSQPTRNFRSPFLYIFLILYYWPYYFCWAFFLFSGKSASVHLFMSLFSKRNRMHRDVQRTHTGTLVVCATSSAISFCRSFWVASRCLLHFASLVLFSPRFTFSLSSQRDWNDSLSFPVTGRLLECWTNRFTNKSPTSRPVPTHLISAASLWISTTTYRVQAGESYYI